LRTVQQLQQMEVQVGKEAHLQQGIPVVVAVVVVAVVV
jgi:hypothetical protein